MDGYFRNYEEYRKTLKGVSRPILTKTKTASLDFRKIKNPGQESNPLILKKKITPCIIIPFDSVANKDQILGSNQIRQT